MTKTQKKILILSIASTAILSVFYFFFFFDPTVVTVGDYKIKKSEIAFRNSLQKMYYPNAEKEFGQEQLVTAYTYAQILKNNGHEITSEIVEKEEKRIDENTKAPEILQKIKDIFKANKEAYRRVYILPTYAERTIYFDFFNKDVRAQAKSLQRCEDFLSEAMSSGRSLSDLAVEKNLIYKKFMISSEKGIEWQKDLSHEKNKGPKIIDKSGNVAPEAVQKAVMQHMQGQSVENIQFWIESVLQNLEPGQLIDQPVDNGEHWMLIRFLEKRGKKFALEGVFIPKDNYEQWLRAEKEKVKVSF